MDDGEDAYQNFRPARVTWGIGELIPETANQVQCEILTEIIRPNKIKKIVASDADKNVFVGRRDDSPWSNNFIAIRNNKTKAIRWYPVDNFLMVPYQSKIDQKPEWAEDQVFSKTLSRLNKGMGSKKIKTRINELENDAVHLSDVVKPIEEAMESNDLVVDTKVDLNPTVTKNYLPPCNRSADSVQEIYRVQDLMSQDIMQNLDEYANEILKDDYTKISSDKKLSPFFLKAFARIPKNLTNIKLLLFADSLLKFIKEPMRVIRSKEPIFCSYSESINQKIIDEFCVIGIGGVRNRPPSMCDKAICYVLTVLLITGEYIVDISILSGVVKPMDYNRLPTLIKALGATPVKGNAVMFCLKLPLYELPLNTSQNKSTRFRKRK